MRAIILAAGSKEKWGNYLGVPKHLIPIKGEPLLHRTIRMLDERWVDEIIVVAQPEDRESFVKFPAQWGEPHAVDRDWTQEMEPSRYLWNPEGRTMILYGDCYFSDALLDTMVNDSTPTWHAYARYDASTITGKPYGEMFGWTFSDTDHAELDAARYKAMEHFEQGRFWRCLGWEVYRAACDLPPGMHSKESVHFVDWSDESDDFDTPEEWEIWRGLYPDKA